MATTRRTILAGALLAVPFSRYLRGLNPELASDRRTQSALQLRQHRALVQSNGPTALSTSNGDETAIPDWVSCFTKGLPQNRFGEVDARAYKSLLVAVDSGRPGDFERIPKGAGRKLSNPQAAFTFHLEGADSHRFSIPPAPSITSEEAATETSELYWQALCRDISFSDYDSSSLIRQAAD